MSKWVLTFFIVISLIVNVITLPLTEIQINFPTPNTSSFSGLFARKISENKVYISNLQEEMIYNIVTNTMEKQIIKPSTCSIGTQCPYLFLEGEKPTYILSKKGQWVTSIDIQNNTYKDTKNNDKVRSVTKFDSNTDLILDGNGGTPGFYVYLHKVNLDSGVITTITRWDEVVDASAFYLSKYSMYFFVSYYDWSKNLNIGYNKGSGNNWKVVLNNIGDSTNSFQMIELKDQKLVICSVNEGKTTVRCFSGVYSDPNGSSFPFTLKQTLTDIINGANSYFSMYKLSDDEIIIGYSKNPMKVQRVNYNLELIGGLLEIGSENEYMDFTMLTQTKLFAIMAKKNTDNTFS